MYEFAPPGRWKAYGETIPIFIRLVAQPGSSSRFLPCRRAPGPVASSGAGHSPSSALDRVADDRAPLLTGRAAEVLAERPGTAVRGGRPLGDRSAELRGAPSRELRPARADEAGVMGVARAGLGDAEDILVEPRGAPRAHAACVRGVPQLDAVDHACRIHLGDDLAQRPLAHREGEIRERMRDDGEAAGAVDPR